MAIEPVNIITQARINLNKFIEKRPDLKTELNGLFVLFLDEIDDGGSPQHEYELFISDCEDLINNFEE